ncbi:DUF4329 domain-containing protein [Salibaculum sp.]|uniref:DUF4329 domain-containing protein n=1 Tax=Salibaculum sp. TaxID=2855480 RepID=UPI002B47A07E|nr:DUF4329 domain-containing protein [Salibaculum sp.]HKL68177.1 DUF4329 domain-containing protein [Salibaculum sp.]
MRAFAIGVALGMVGMAQAQHVPDPSWEEIDYAKSVLAEIQPRSIAKRREYCGFIGRDTDGSLVATPAVPGTVASCLPIWPRADEMRVVASYHTHGAFDLGYINEVPSDIDLEGDIFRGIDGWVATPGGRLWFNDAAAEETRLVCGVGCLPVSPEFYKGLNGPVAKRYSLQELSAKTDGG